MPKESYGEVIVSVALAPGDPEGVGSGIEELRRVGGGGSGAFRLHHQDVTRVRLAVLVAGSQAEPVQRIRLQMVHASALQQPPVRFSECFSLAAVAHLKKFLLLLARWLYQDCTAVSHRSSTPNSLLISIFSIATPSPPMNNIVNL